MVDWPFFNFVQGLGASIVRVGARVPVVALAHLPRLVMPTSWGLMPVQAACLSLPLHPTHCWPPLDAADPGALRRRNAAARPARLDSPSKRPLPTAHDGGCTCASQEQRKQDNRSPKTRQQGRTGIPEGVCVCVSLLSLSLSR